MRLAKVAVFLLAVLFVAAVAWAEMPLNTPDLPADGIAKVESGGIYFTSKTGKDAQGNVTGGGMAVGYFKANKDKIIDTILDYPQYPEFMPQVSAIEIIGSGDHQVVKYTIKIFLFKITYHMKHTVDREAGVVRYMLDKTKENEIANSEGYWVIKPYKDGNLVYYFADVDTGLKVPGKVQEYLTKSSLPKVVAAMKKRTGG
jgi:ribosome-associated toxin RatA of RatAB toxin-antitoxin module